MGFGTTELLVVLLIVVVIFGASRLPGLGKGLGEGMRSFRDALKGEEKNEGGSTKDLGANENNNPSVTSGDESKKES